MPNQIIQDPFTDTNNAIKRLLGQIESRLPSADVVKRMDNLPPRSAHFSERKHTFGDMQPKAAHQWALEWVKNAVKLLESDYIKPIREAQQPPRQPLMIQPAGEHARFVERHVTELDVAAAKFAATVATKRWLHPPKDAQGRDMFDIAIEELRELQQQKSAEANGAVDNMLGVLADNFATLKMQCEQMASIVKEQNQKIQAVGGRG
jgi:hypothetical protein